MEYAIIFIFHFSEGTLSEGWLLYDAMARFAQLGVLPQLKDILVVDYAGLQASAMTNEQREMLHDRDKPTRDHIHVVIRTPNGNDYGKDLLSQHLAEHKH